MKKLAFAVLILFLLPFMDMMGHPSRQSASDDSADSQASRYISPTPDSFPIIASSPVYDNRIPTRRDIELLTQCGFNCAIGSASTNALCTLLRDVEDLDFSLIYDVATHFNRDFSPCRNKISAIRSYLEREGLRSSLIGGYRIKDEPTISELDDLKDFLDSVHSADSTVMPLVNLFGSHFRNAMQRESPQHEYSGDASRRDAYLNYLNTYYQTVQPGAWCYDYYPFTCNSQNDEVGICRNDFYYDLQLFAHLSRQTGIPFWAFCQSTHVHTWDATGTSYQGHPEATEQRLRFEAFNALAFGAQGLIYWRYADQDSHGVEEYISSLVDQDGDPYPAWTAAQTINREIRKYQNVFLGAKVKGYFFLGSQHIRPEGVGDIPDTIPGLHARLVSGPGALISELSNGGTKYLVVVNQDPDSVTQVSLTAKWHSLAILPQDFRYFEIQDSIGIVQREPVVVPYITTRVTLQPSKYVIYGYIE